MGIQLFNVSPRLPEEIGFLEKLSYNIWWCWHPLAIELFVRISPNLWREVEGNARRFLSLVPQSRLEDLAKDHNYVRQLKAVQQEFERCVGNTDAIGDRSIAYFSMEFGIHESVRIFSGGLGVLSGDHLKAASDMKLPLIAIGLFYRQGYFRQVLDRNGHQTERYPENEIHNMPVVRGRDPEGNPVVISIKLLDQEVFANVWILWVGNIPLVLLDTEISKNPPEFREVAWRLYGGDKTMRLRQELLLGVGGYKALQALGCRPAVCHMNEGHAAFMSIARIEDFVVNSGYDADTALEIVWRTNIFTTHTPVPAGNEVFDNSEVRPYLSALVENTGLDVDRVIRWGIPISERDTATEMSMTVLGLRLSNYSNGVSKLHGEVAREMWKHLWPERSVSEIPITHITNGVHIDSWISPRMRILFDRYLPAKWSQNLDPARLREGVMNIPDEELWMGHELCRQAMVRRARQIAQHTAGFTADHAAGSGGINKILLDPDILTIGFARRFATYKRGTLLLRQKERLLALLRNKQRQIQFIFAGKAHPADEGGKRLIQDLIVFARENNVQDRLLFLEDYDISLARSLVQGVDVWLNTPRRPQEASGTSGMKAAINGVVNCSILDGWWAEAYAPECGWAIVGNENYTDDEDVDNYEAQELLNILEDEIIPCFYERSGDLPQRWVARMKESIIMSLGRFSSARMVEEYDEMFYEPARQDYQRLIADNAAAARDLVARKWRLINNFDKLSIERPEISGSLDDAHVGDKFTVSTRVSFAGLSPEEVDVEVYYGPVNVHNEIVYGNVQVMKRTGDLGDGYYRYECELECDLTGRYGLTARITPTSHDWDNSVPGFMSWPKN